MIETIKWKQRLTNFTGRNGMGKCSGIELLTLEHEDVLMISPLTSRDAVAHGHIDVPYEDIPDLIDALYKILGGK